MFNWKLFLLLTAISLPGIMGTAPKFVLSIKTVARDKLPENKEPLSVAQLMVMLVGQNLGLGFILIAVGTLAAPRVGLKAPVFNALLEGNQVWPILQKQLRVILSLGLGGGIVFTAFYYLWYRPRLEQVTVAAREELEANLGLRGKLLYGGVTEEVFARWGLMSLMVWLGKLILNQVTPGLIWTAILLSSLLFGGFYLPNYLAAGCRPSFRFFSLEIILNLGTGLVFGWLFWQYSLAAAMLAHMLFYLVSYPVNQRYSVN